MKANPEKWNEMDGSTEVVKRLNSYLTCKFVTTETAQSDECLNEAIKITSEYMVTRMTKEEFVDWVDNYLTKQFMPKTSLISRNALNESLEIVELLKDYSE